MVGMNVQIVAREPALVSISSWGLFDLPRPPLFIVPDGFEFQEADMRAPGHIVWMPSGRDD